MGHDWLEEIGHCPWTLQGSCRGTRKKRGERGCKSREAMQRTDRGRARPALPDLCMIAFSSLTSSFQKVAVWVSIHISKKKNSELFGVCYPCLVQFFFFWCSPKNKKGTRRHRVYEKAKGGPVGTDLFGLMTSFSPTSRTSCPFLLLFWRKHCDPMDWWFARRSKKYRTQKGTGGFRSCVKKCGKKKPRAWALFCGFFFLSRFFL